MDNEREAAFAKYRDEQLGGVGGNWDGLDAAHFRAGFDAGYNARGEAGWTATKDGSVPDTSRFLHATICDGAGSRFVAQGYYDGVGQWYWKYCTDRFEPLPDGLVVVAYRDIESVLPYTEDK